MAKPYSRANHYRLSAHPVSHREQTVASLPWLLSWLRCFHWGSQVQYCRCNGRPLRGSCFHLTWRDQNLFWAMVWLVLCEISSVLVVAFSLDYCLHSRSPFLEATDPKSFFCKSALLKPRLHLHVYNVLVTGDRDALRHSIARSTWPRPLLAWLCRLLSMYLTNFTLRSNLYIKSSISGSSRVVLNSGNGLFEVILVYSGRNLTSRSLNPNIRWEMIYQHSCNHVVCLVCNMRTDRLIWMTA